MTKMNYQRLACHAAFMLALGFVFGLGHPTDVKASILLPENSAFGVDSEQLIVSIEDLSSKSKSGSSAPLASVDETPAEPEDTLLVRQLAAMASHAEGSSSGTSSSSGSSSAGSGASLLTKTAVVLFDDLPARRGADDQALFLPDAPGTELLRPPQQ